MSLPKPYYDKDGITIYHADCREVLLYIAADLVLTDPPYGTTANKWDNRIDPEQLAYLFGRFKTIVITASQPFTSLAVCADINRFRHEWIWQKNRGSNFLNTCREPMKEHESVLVFSDGNWTYNAQLQERNGAGAARAKHTINPSTNTSNYGAVSKSPAMIDPSTRVPSSIQRFNTETGLHPTQKPQKLFEYLILTYSNETQTILDPFMGSGTTLVAAKQLGRKCVGIELEEKYCEIAVQRLAQDILPFGEVA
jgi:site-specific DNA-methyltransferase (adenine-specific)